MILSKHSISTHAFIYEKQFCSLLSISNRAIINSLRIGLFADVILNQSIYYQEHLCLLMFPSIHTYCLFKRKSLQFTVRLMGLHGVPDQLDHLHNIERIRTYLTSAAVACLVHTFITSQLDTNNSLLLGLPTTQLRRIQCTQNSTARLITETTVGEHSTIVLRFPYWLPIAQRIQFKILVQVFQALHGEAPYT